MRNHRSFKPTAPKAPKAVEPDRVKSDDALTAEIRELRKAIENATSDPKAQSVDSPELRRLSENIAAALERPRRMSVEVIRDEAGEIVGMIGSTDPGDIARISSGKPVDDMAVVDRWMKTVS